jgi:outer membrane receptor protein involved in Fe transport
MSECSILRRRTRERIIRCIRIDSFVIYVNWKEIVFMRQLKRVIVPILLLVIACTFPLWSGTTGKIDGKITDKVNGEPQIGANIVIVGTSLGASSDVEGQYTILSVPPGVYTVQVSFIGYKKIVVNDVRVFIDQTTRVDITMEPQVIELGETVVLAERKLIRTDVATSVAAISDKDIETLPIGNVVSAVGLQAGIRGGWTSAPGYAAQPSYITMKYTRGNVSANGPSIRGGSGDNVLFMVDGVTQRDPRNNEPTTSIALSAVKEIAVERGGFNAEYGQVRSGLINVVTKEGSKQGYYGSFQGKLTPAGPRYEKYPGILDVNDPYSWALRSYFDPAVCWTGTDNGAWNEYIKKQYPSFQGWNAVSKLLCTDDKPDNNLTPAGAQRAFEYILRKGQVTDQPDYDIDAGFGGPVPFVSEMLGGLRFFASYRANDEILLFPLARPDYRSYDGSVQINSDITPTMKLRFSALFGKQFTQRWSWDAAGTYSYIHWPSDFVTGGQVGFPLYSDYNLSISDIGYHSYSAKFTNAISQQTYYEISVDNYRRDYFTRPIALRDTSKKYEVLPGYYMGEFPYGYWNNATEDLDFLIVGTMHAAKARDNSVVSATTVKADFSSQVNFKNLVKSGIEVVFNDLNLDYGRKALNDWEYHTLMHVYPFRAAAYLQDKLETEGFTLNAGLRLDYSDPKINWWSVDPYNADFYSANYKSTTTVFTTERVKAQWQLSPRLGIAHPISESSKLFFNYGHFKQLPQYEAMFRVDRDNKGQATTIGNPNLTLAKTISYELGYDQILFEDYLLKVAAYYNDITDQQDATVYNSSADGFAYAMSTSNNYQDSRGFELTIQKSTGRWVTGFINYTYQVNTTGHFGHSQLYDDIVQQNQFNTATTNLYQDRPIAQPFARLNLNFVTPDDWGPTVFNHPILGGWGLNVTADWQAGYWTTWNPQNIAAIAYNVQAEDFFNTTLRLDKYIALGKFKVQLFMDMSNVLGTRRLIFPNVGTQDYTDYMSSLHLPQSSAYSNIPGDDKVGAYRTPGVEFQPMEYLKQINKDQTGKTYVIYFEGSSKQYWQFVNDPTNTMNIQDRWKLVDKAKIDQINNDKAYIDMPNQSTWWFLDPRRITFGLKLSFDFTE